MHIDVADHLAERSTNSRSVMGGLPRLNGFANCRRRAPREQQCLDHIIHVVDVALELPLVVERDRLACQRRGR